MAARPYRVTISTGNDEMRSFLHPNVLMLAILVVAILVALAS